MRRGRLKDDDFYAGVAERYLAALKTDGRRPIAVMSQQFKAEGYKAATPEQVRDWVHRSREYGWLTAGRRGYAGAEPGPKLLERRHREQARRRKEGGK
jgi:hypothetical protein